MIDVRTIGEFGVSFSRDMDQTWVHLQRSKDGFIASFFQNFEDLDSDEEDEFIDIETPISFDLAESAISRAYEDGHLEMWAHQYSRESEGTESDLNWTIDVDDNDGGDILLLSGNWKLPPNDWMKAVVEAVRLVEPRFMLCVKAFK